MSIKKFLLKMIQLDESWKTYTIKDIDQGIHIAAWIEDTLLKQYSKHVRHDTIGIITGYYDSKELVCTVTMYRYPNAQDIHEITICIKPELIKENDILQQEMFDLLL